MNSPMSAPEGIADEMAEVAADAADVALSSAGPMVGPRWGAFGASMAVTLREGASNCKQAASAPASRPDAPSLGHRKAQLRQQPTHASVDVVDDLAHLGNRKALWVTD